MDDDYEGVHVRVQIVDYSDRNEDGEPLRVSHEQAFTRDTLDRFGSRAFAEAVIGMSGASVFQRFREESPRGLKFAHSPAVRVVHGYADTTIRFDPEGEHAYEPGEVVEFVYAPTGDVFARARIETVDEDVKASDALHYARTYPASSLTELLDSLNRHYDEPIEHDTRLSVLTFEVLDTYPDEVDL